MKRRRCISNRKNTSRDRVSSLGGIVGVQGRRNLSRAIKDNSAKTSEYAFFQKFKKQAGQNCNSSSILEKDGYNKKLEYVDCLKERSIIAQRSPKRAVIASYTNDVSSLNTRSFLTPLKVGSPSKVSDTPDLDIACPQMGEDLFSTKRVRLYHHVRKILGLEINQLCSKRGNVIDVLVRRLFPQDEDANISILNNSQQCMFPATEFADLPREKKCIESPDSGTVDLVPSRLDAIEHRPPFSLQAEGSNYYDSRWVIENRRTEDPYIHDGRQSLSMRPFNPLDCGWELDEADELEPSFEYQHGYMQYLPGKPFTSKIHTGGRSSSLSDSSPCFDSAVLFCLHWDAVLGSCIRPDEDSLCSNVNSSSDEFSMSVFATSDSPSFGLNPHVN